MAHLKTKATTQNLGEREKWKWSLIRGLYDRGFDREQIIRLFGIIDIMMELPKKLQESLDSKIKTFEMEKQQLQMMKSEIFIVYAGELNCYGSF